VSPGSKDKNPRNAETMQRLKDANQRDPETQQDQQVNIPAAEQRASDAYRDRDQS
jgi:hypothetical protein